MIDKSMEKSIRKFITWLHRRGYKIGYVWLDGIKSLNDNDINGLVIEFLKTHYNEDNKMVKPQKRHSRLWGDSYDDGQCPNCGACYSAGLSDNPLYCSQCGAAFDWSEEE